MASFDPDENAAQESSSECKKYSMKRLDMSIRKFVRVLDIDLNRLYKHKTNIERLTKVDDWNGLHREQINASQTIQQIKANIKEIEKARDQVNDNELSDFDEKVQGVKAKAMLAMEEFMHFIGMHAKSDLQILESDLSEKQYISSGTDNFKGMSIPSGDYEVFSNSAKKQFLCCEDYADSINQCPATPYGSLPGNFNTIQKPLTSTSLHVVPQDSEAAASWEQLQENIVELNEMVHHFAAEVEQQETVVTRIDENIESAHQNVKEGAGHLAKAAKYKSVLLPVVGAVVGGVVAGPIGLVAGIKIGGLAGAVGGAVGFAGGRYVKKRQEKITDLELQNLSDRRCASLSNLPDIHKGEGLPVASKFPETKQVSEPEDTNTVTTVTSSFKRFFSLADDSQ